MHCPGFAGFDWDAPEICERMPEAITGKREAK